MCAHVIVLKTCAAESKRISVDKGRFDFEMGDIRQSTLAQDAEKYRLSHGDLEVIAEGKPIPCVASIFEVRSEPFRDWLKQQRKTLALDSNSNVAFDKIQLPSARYPVAEAFVQFMHNDTAEHLDEFALELLPLANSYEVAGLKAACEKALMGCVDDQTAVIFLMVAGECRADNLKAACLQWLKSDTERKFLKSKIFHKIKVENPSLAFEVFETD